MLRRRHRSSFAGLEPLEGRWLLSTGLVVNDTPGVDAITLGVTAAGGVSVIVNGNQTDYAPGQWDSVLIWSTAGQDTINVRATVVPSVVHYLRDPVTVKVGDASGVQNIKASLNMNGATGGPVVPGYAMITIDDTGDSAARNVMMTRIGDKEAITGLAPAEISIGVEVSPVGPEPVSDLGDVLSLTTGSGADTIVVRGLRDALRTTFYNAAGNDAINVGDGSLLEIGSNVTVWGRPVPTGLLPGNIAVTVDDSKGTMARQYDLSVIRPPGPGPIQIIAYNGDFWGTREVSYRVQEVATATINGGSAADTLVVHEIENRLEGPGTVVTLNAGGGNDNASVEATALGSMLVVNGQGGDDLLKAGPIGPWQGVSDLEFIGGDGRNTLIVQGPLASPLDIPTVPVEVSAGRIEHRSVVFRYSDVGHLVLQNGWFNITGDLGPVDLTITSESSGISFESSTSVEINATQHLRALAIMSGPVQLTAGGNKVLNSSSLDVKGDGTLDLTDNSLEVHYNVIIPFTSIRKWVIGKQIFSSRADARHNLGYGDFSGGTDFAPFGTVVVKYTLYGDANLDRRVDFTDLVALAQHYGDNSGNANWDEGDFTYDGKVDFGDLTLLAQNYNTSMAAAAAAPSIVAPVRAKEAATPAVRRRPQARPR
jgi:hypothetical protein